MRNNYSPARFDGTKQGGGADDIGSQLAGFPSFHLVSKNGLCVSILEIRCDMWKEAHLTV